LVLTREAGQDLGEVQAYISVLTREAGQDLGEVQAYISVLTRGAGQGLDEVQTYIQVLICCVRMLGAGQNLDEVQAYILVRRVLGFGKGTVAETGLTPAQRLELLTHYWKDRMFLIHIAQLVLLNAYGAPRRAFGGLLLVCVGSWYERSCLGVAVEERPRFVAFGGLPSMYADGMKDHALELLL
jgi:hypothetical protein